MSINEKDLTIILETTYILFNNKNIKPEVINISSPIWKDKVFENKDSAFAELTEYVNLTLDNGAKQLSKEEHDEITKYFNMTPILSQKGSYLKSIKIGHTAYVYTFKTIRVG